MYSKDKKELAVKLRKEGYALSYISKKISVAKSTLSLWLIDVPFIPNELTQYSVIKGQKYNSIIKRADKALSLRQAELYAQGAIKPLSTQELFFLGIGIYIGEGSKIGNITRVVNSDPRIVKLAIEWFRRCFYVSNSHFMVRLHLYPDCNQKEAVEFWSRELALKKSSFYVPHVDDRLDKKAKKRKVLPYGTAHLTVNSNGDKNLGVLLHRKIIASIDRVLNIAVT